LPKYKNLAINQTYTDTRTWQSCVCACTDMGKKGEEEAQKVSDRLQVICIQKGMQQEQW